MAERKDNLAELRSLLSREAISSSASSTASGQALETAPTSDPADPGSPGSSCTVPTDPLIEAGLKPEKPTSSSVDHLLRVLMVEDNKNDCELILRQLMRCGFEPRVRRVDNGAELQRALEQDFWDIIITDHNLPTFSGAEAIALIRNIGLNIPTLCVTGSADPAKITEIIAAGAYAVISKDDLAPLCAAVTRALQRGASQSEPPGHSASGDDGVKQD